MICSAISYKASPDPRSALDFLLDPFRQQFVKPDHDLIPRLQRLTILVERFKRKVLYASDVNWRYPFSTGFYLLEKIKLNPPEDLAKLITDTDFKRFMQLTPADVFMPENKWPSWIGVYWSDLSDDTAACVTADDNLLSYMGTLAEVR